MYKTRGCQKNNILYNIWHFSEPSNANGRLQCTFHIPAVDSSSCSGDRVIPMASDIKGHVIKVIHDIKGQGWSGSVGMPGDGPGCKLV